MAKRRVEDAVYKAPLFIGAFTRPPGDENVKKRTPLFVSRLTMSYSLLKDKRMENENEKNIRIGISSCLLGNQVRFDGGHKHDRYITQTLGQFFDFVPVCPEVECGLPVPREAMRLLGDPEAPRLVTVKSGIDHTKTMLSWAKKRVIALENEGLCGFIFKSRSPSSGMARVKVYDANSVPRNIGVGLFAKAFMDHFPLLPVEEEGRLHDIPLRENFIESVFVYKRWRDLLAHASAGQLVDFHTEHKLLLRAHSEKHYRELGRIAAQAGNIPKKVLFTRYQETLMAAMRLKPTVKKHVNVMLHMMGYFKKLLTSDEKQELLETIDSFRNYHVPLIVPITLFNHYIRKYQEPYLQRQYYLNPHPLELKLRNHA
jgi:uncharacterized protein YbgA (DUF1722 family)/uncharacterized protein YbbK (DUF523 family)